LILRHLCRAGTCFKCIDPLRKRQTLNETELRTHHLLLI